MIVQSSLDLAVRRQLVGHNAAHATNARRQPTRNTSRTWTPLELACFSASASQLRLYPAVHPGGVRRDALRLDRIVKRTPRY